ncbi:MAG: hypothetical protein ACTSQY_03525 [Candidatus Odinarchaeia archaeon]
MTGNISISKVTFEPKKIKEQLEEAKKHINDDKKLFNILWKLRSDIEYYIAILALELEDKINIEEHTKTIRIKKSERDKNKILGLIEENLDKIQEPDGDFYNLFESIWKMRELLTILVREVEPKPKKNES